MSALYLWLMTGTIFFPLVLSFDKKVQYYKNWKWAILSALIVSIPYLIWDQYFTENLIWGFNEDYLIGWKIGDLPIEEISFFIVVPFACLFIYECVKYYFRNVRLKSFNFAFYLLFFAYAIFVGEQKLGGWYTFSAIGLGLILLIILFIKRHKYPYLPLAFVFAIIPFLLVNGVLTGTGIEDPIVWYNNQHFSEWRMWTIPFEDLVYGFGLIAINIMVFEAFEKSKKK